MIRWFNNLKLQTKFLALFALACILGTVSTAWNVRNINEFNAIVDQSTLAIQKTDTIGTLANVLTQIELDTDSLSYTEDSSYVPHIAGNTQRAEQLVAALKEGVDTGVDTNSFYPEYVSTVEELATSITDLKAAVSDMQTAHQENRDADVVAAADDLLTQDSPLSIAATDASDLRYWASLGAADVERAATDVRQASVIFSVLVIALFFVLALATALATNSVSQPLMYLGDAIVGFESGAYNGELLTGLEDRGDEVGQMVTSFNQMVDSITESNRHKDQVLSASSRFVPGAYLDFLEKPDIVDVRLGDHVAARMTVMFSDIRGFTTMSEGMTPAENFDFVNRYLQRVSPAIQEHNGFVVKFLGDGMMALFPYDVEDAVKAGLEKQHISQEITAEMNAAGFAGTINLGIGLHIGDMMVGMIGEELRLQGDAFSDNVNLTSRLEGLNKTFGTNVIISEDARQRLTNADKYLMRPLGKVQVKGRETALMLYEIFEADLDDLRQAKLDTRPLYEEALKLYTAGSFLQSQQLFKDVLKQNPADRTAAFYVEQTEYLIAHGAPDDWDGVIVMTTK